MVIVAWNLVAALLAISSITHDEASTLLLLWWMSHAGSDVSEVLRSTKAVGSAVPLTLRILVCTVKLHTHLAAVVDIQARAAVSTRKLFADGWGWKTAVSLPVGVGLAVGGAKVV